jgi:hypothetical protein
MKRFFVLVVLVLTFFVPVNSFAEEVPENPESLEKGEKVDLKKIPPILDPHYRHHKKGQFELFPYIGSYLGASFGQTWIAGGRLGYHFNNTFSLNGGYAFSKLYLNKASGYGATLTSDNVHYVDGQLMISTDAAIRTGKSVLELDLFTSLGVGAVKANNMWEPMGIIGGGVKIYTGLPWLAGRIDVNAYLHPTKHETAEPIDVDVGFLGGLSFLFPTKPSPYEK